MAAARHSQPRLHRLDRAFADADIVVASRRMPRGCNQSWLKLDRQALSQSGGMALYLGKTPHVETASSGWPIIRGDRLRFSRLDR